MYKMRKHLQNSVYFLGHSRRPRGPPGIYSGLARRTASWLVAATELSRQSRDVAIFGLRRLAALSLGIGARFSLPRGKKAPSPQHMISNDECLAWRVSFKMGFPVRAGSARVVEFLIF